MDDTPARGHPLDVAVAVSAGVAEAVGVVHDAVHGGCDGLETAMGVLGEARDALAVVHPVQGAGVEVRAVTTTGRAHLLVARGVRVVVVDREEERIGGLEREGKTRNFLHDGRCHGGGGGGSAPGLAEVPTRERKSGLPRHGKGRGRGVGGARLRSADPWSRRERRARESSRPNRRRSARVSREITRSTARRGAVRRSRYVSVDEGGGFGDLASRAHKSARARRSRLRGLVLTHFVRVRFVRSSEADPRAIVAGGVFVHPRRSVVKIWGWAP